MSILYTVSAGIISTVLAFLLFLLLTFGVHDIISSNKRRGLDK